MKRQDSTEYILYLSYGKDSLACLEAIKRLGYPLDRIVHAEVWATDTIPADLPPMVEFKARADKIIKERYGIEVEHIYAVRRGGRSPMTDNSTNKSMQENGEETPTVFPSLSERGVIVDSKSQQCQKLTYEDIFYREIKSRGGAGITDFQHFARLGAIRPSKCQQSKNHRFCNEMEPILHRRTQACHTYGFPISIGRGNWCTQLKTRVF